MKSEDEDDKIDKEKKKIKKKYQDTRQREHGIEVVRRILSKSLSVIFKTPGKFPLLS